MTEDERQEMLSTIAAMHEGYEALMDRAKEYREERDKAIRRAYSLGVSQSTIGDLTGLTRQRIFQICRVDKSKASN